MRRCFALALIAAVSAAAAAGPEPEIQRAPIPAQKAGAVHTLRTIPEACVRIEGGFTGEASQPYRFAVVRTSPNCQPRARFVDAAKAQPSEQAGWKFNDLIRVPDADCPTRHAVVRIWRKPADVAPPELDAQGRARLYLQDSKRAAAADRIAAVPMFAAAMAVEGEGCQ